jgi:[2Fe-2S] binding domain
MVMSTVALLAREPAPGEAAIRAALDGNICRCGGYPRIVDAVRHAVTADRLAVEVPEAEVPQDAGDAWTVVLPPLPRSSDAGRGWGSTAAAGPPGSPARSMLVRATAPSSPG